MRPGRKSCSAGEAGAFFALLVEGALPALPGEEVGAEVAPAEAAGGEEVVPAEAAGDEEVVPAEAAGDEE